MKFPLSEIDEAKCLKLVCSIVEDSLNSPTVGGVWQLYKSSGSLTYEYFELLSVYVLNTNDGYKFFESKERAEKMKIFFM